MGTKRDGTEVIKARFNKKEGNTQRNLNGLGFLSSARGKTMLDFPTITFKQKSCTLVFKNSKPEHAQPKEKKKTGGDKRKEKRVQAQEW